MKLLIDGDLIAYRCASSCEPTKIKPEREPLVSALSRTDELIYRILLRCATEEHRVFLSSSENFRKTLDPNYKANRTQPKPEYLDACRNLLVEEWGAEICTGYEADDGIGIAADGAFIICTIDKDLRQIPGTHYNFVKDEITEVDSWNAIRNFWNQMLTGDSSDNVIGIRGIGPVRAERILSGVHPQDMEAVVHDCYRSADRSDESFIANYRLLRIIRSVEELNEIEICIREGQRPQLTEACRFHYTE